MHFFKAFTLLVTVALAALAVALPAAGTNEIAVKRDCTACGDMANTLGGVSILTNSMLNGGWKSKQT
jgi:hypothetical protein